MSTETVRHSPGPYHINAILRGRIVGDETANGFEKLQLCGRNCTVATVYRRDDARLLKAAPELLEACQRAQNWIREYIAQLGGDPFDQGMVALHNDLISAIAKAEGRE